MTLGIRGKGWRLIQSLREIMEKVWDIIHDGIPHNDVVQAIICMGDPATYADPLIQISDTRFQSCIKCTSVIERLTNYRELPLKSGA